jgi:hypothetical protein
VTKFIDRMKHSPVHNYGGIPGITSWLIGAPGPNGLVRLLECSRDHFEPVVPHSHRFDFECRVLSGTVRNIIWTTDMEGDEYRTTSLRYAGAPGQYDKMDLGITRWAFQTKTYCEGDTYSMHWDEVHSIFFSRGTSVLFFEAAPETDRSIILQPVVDGETIPTFKVEDWMFKKGGV